VTPPPLWLRLVPVGLVLAGAGVAFARRDDITPAAIEAGIGLVGPWMGPVFVLVHVATSLVSVPRWAMAIVAGLLFGLVGGTLWSLAGTLAGTSAGFFLARFVNAGAFVPHDLPRVGPWIARACFPFRVPRSITDSACRPSAIATSRSARCWAPCPLPPYSPIWVRPAGPIRRPRASS